MDDIRAGLSDMAENGEGAQRAQAYRMLMSMNPGEAVVVVPKSDEEVTIRLARLMYWAGKPICQAAYGRAFPTPDGRASTRKVFERAKYGDPRLDIKIDYSKLPTTLTQLYRMFPETRRVGMMPGFPAGGSIEKKTEWVRRKAIEILEDRKRQQLAEIEQRDRQELDLPEKIDLPSLTSGTTDGSPQTPQA